MDFLKTAVVFSALALPAAAHAGYTEYDYYGFARATAGYVYDNKNSSFTERNFHLPVYGQAGATYTYRFDDKTSVGISGAFKIQTGSYIENLNQGNWGEEVFGTVQSRYGEFFFGQQPNTAVMMGVNRGYLPIWQITPVNITDYIHNPNWQQRGRRKYYGTLPSTLIDTDGSSLKFSYISSEFYNTKIGIDYIPQNRANNSLADRRSPYYKKEAYVLTLYRRHDLGPAEAEYYLGYADFNQSHREYAGGISLYRKGLALFASYRKSVLSGGKYKIAGSSNASSLPPYYDGYRNGRAWNAGLSYEWFFLTSTLSYFQSESDNIDHAKNKILSLHLSFTSYKYLDIYSGIALVDFKSNRLQAGHGKDDGAVFYGGVEISF